MFKKIFVVFSFIFFISIYSFAAQFEDYKWGMEIDKAKEIIQKKGKKIMIENLQQAPICIGYEDIVLGSPCVIVLNFTPKSHLLNIVVIRWKNEAILNGLVDLMYKKYGNMSDEEGYTYKWRDYTGSKYDKISINYLNGITLSYVSGEYMEIGKKEAGEIASKEIDRF